MALISSPGIGSGLNVNSIVAKLVAAEGQPVTAHLNQEEAQLQGKISALGSFKGALSSLQSSLSNLVTTSSFQQRSASSSDTSILGISANSTAAAGNYSIAVNTLAQTQKLASAAYADTTTSITGGVGGTLTFRFGTYDSTANTFTVNTKTPTQTVTINAADSSLSGIRDAINAANISVTASIINDGTGNRLSIVSKNSGAANSMQLTVTDGDGTNTNTTGLSALAYDPTAAVGSGKNLTQTVAAQDASLTIDGLAIISPTNTLSAAIQGVTLTLASAAPGTTVTAAVSRDTASIKTAVNSFVSSYNKYMSTVNSLSSYDVKTRKAGPLLGDATLRTVTSQVSRVLSSAVSGLSAGAYQSLGDLGISLQNDGTLVLDSSKLDAALSANPDAVAKVFAASVTASDSLINATAMGPTAQTGNYGVTITQLATHGVYTGTTTAAFPLTVDTTNNSFTVKVDGITSGLVSLTQKTYASGADLAAEIQGRINGDPTLMAADSSVTVGFQSNHFVITSNRYGSASTVAFTSVGTNTPTTLGFTATAGTAGLDVAGTVAGLPATGSGQTLTGTGLVDGVALDVTGGVIGDRGTVSLSRGIAYQLNTLLSSVLSSSGAIGTSTTGLNSMIADIGKQRVALAARLAQVKQNYLTQFTALDIVIANLRSTSSYLSQQLTGLPTTKPM